jgi:hypothetical protein
MAKMKSGWEYGILVGGRWRSGEFWVVDKEGEVKSVRSVKRIPGVERWSKDNRRWVKGVPWNRYKGYEYQDGEEFQIRKKDVGKHGTSRGLRGGQQLVPWSGPSAPFGEVTRKIQVLPER